MQLNEQEYWQQVRQGDKKAFERLFNTYYSPLCNYAASLLKNIDDAEEVVQNTFFNIWNKREVLGINTSFKSYMYRAVHNDCLNKIKHGKVRALYAADYKTSVGANTGGNGSEILEAKELSSQITNAIASLPEQCGIVFKLSRFENLKYAEIAEQLEISVKTVENHMGKALKLLRAELKEYLPLVIWLLLVN